LANALKTISETLFGSGNTSAGEDGSTINGSNNLVKVVGPNAAMLPPLTKMLDPGFGPAHFRLGGLLRDEGRLGEARESYERALRVVPQWADVWAGHAATCERLGDVHTAEASWRKALGLNPTFTDARVGLAGLLARRGAPEAKRLVAEARAYDPLHPRVRALDDARLHELLEEGVSG